jgi:WD40 repeat protein
VPGTRSSLVSGDGSRLVTFDADGKTIRFTNTASRTEIPGLQLPSGDYSLAAMAPEGSSVGVGSDTEWYRVALAPKPAIARAVKPAHAPIVVSDDGAFSMWRDGDLVHLSLTKTAKTLVTERTEPGPQPAVAAVGEGKVAYTLGLGEVETYDLKTRKKTKFAPKSVPTALAAGGGNELVVGDEGGGLTLCDADTGAVSWSVPAHGDRILGVRSYPAAGRVSTFSSDGTAAVWDLKSGKLIARLSGNAADISSVDLSADGSRVITGSEDGTVEIWDAASGGQLGALKTGLRPLILVRFLGADAAVSVDARGRVDTYLAPVAAGP